MSHNYLFDYLFDLFKRRGDWDAMMADGDKALGILGLSLDVDSPEYHENHGVISGVAMSYWARGYAAASGRNTEECIKELMS